jgi:hypothetical protein
VNIRNKFGDFGSLNAAITPASQRKVEIAGEEHPFDDSKAPTLFVDVVTEAGAANGIVCIGLGHLIFPPQGKAHVEGDVHIRLSVPMAATLVETLSDALRRAADQQSKMDNIHRAN